MGTPVQIIQPGLECVHWEPADETPDAMYIMFWDIEKGDAVGAREPPNGHLFRLEQNPDSPCDYDHEGQHGNWLVEFNLQANLHSVNLRDWTDPNKIYFLGHEHEATIDEYDVVVNDLVDPWGNYGFNGYCTILWMAHIVELAIEFGLKQFDDLLFEIFPADPPNLVVKFCSLSARTNIKLKFPI